MAVLWVTKGAALVSISSRSAVLLLVAAFVTYHQQPGGRSRCTPWSAHLLPVPGGMYADIAWHYGCMHHLLSMQLACPSIALPALWLSIKHNDSLLNTSS
eukprot:GHUV01030107.1.p2 GENE.GHUV01030107.1~~GHUV01030107.1.p2  ORF type:complete len:100 (+),score=20.74 GHUV01030107.1:533-832(+)